MLRLVVVTVGGGARPNEIVNSSSSPFVDNPLIIYYNKYEILLLCEYYNEGATAPISH